MCGITRRRVLADHRIGRTGIPRPRTLGRHADGAVGEEGGDLLWFLVMRMQVFSAVPVLSSDPSAPRVARNLFAVLSGWMLGFGLLTGLAFPFFSLALGVPRALALSPRFFAATVLAGVLVGGLGDLLARTVVRPRIRRLADQMHQIASSITVAIYDGDWASCRPEQCRITEQSRDEIGESARAFNRLVEALAKAKDVESAVSDFTRSVASELDLGCLAEAALSLMMDRAHAAAGAILVERDGKLGVVAVRGLRDPERIAVNDHVMRAVNGGQRQHIEYPPDIVVDGLLADVRPREVWVFPVVYKSSRIGAVLLAATQLLGVDVLRLLELLHQSFGLALHNALTHDQLQRIAALDPLTSAYNRRFGMARLGEELNRADRTDAPLAVLMFDVDHFKGVNDTYGHLAGDRVLVELVRIGRAVSREGDILIRYGGEEFLVVLPGAAREEAREVGERLRRKLAETPISVGAQALRVTVSVGVASHPEDVVSCAEDLVRWADEALYAAKAAGRDRVVVSRPPEGSVAPIRRGARNRAEPVA